MGAKQQVTVAPGAGQRRRAAPPRGGLSAPLLPARASKPVSVVVGACLLLVVALGIASAHQSRGNAIDRAVDSWIISLHVPPRALSAVSLLGGGAEMATMTAVLAIGCLAARRRTAALLAVVSVSAAAALTELVLKPLVHRTLAGDLTYPSGHTTGVFAVATVIAVVVLAARRWRPAARAAVLIAAAVIASAVGFAMIGLRYHYFTDTVGGAAVGAGTVLGVALLLDAPPVRRWLGRLGG